MTRLNHKVAIVTGAASGLGEADARMMTREGAQVLLTDIDSARGQRIADEIGAAFFAQDVADESSWSDLMALVSSRFGRIDILVNNAGIAIPESITETTTDHWRKTLAVHLDGTFFGCRAAIPLMAASGGGSIINMSSVAALRGLSAYLAYSAAKGGIRSMTKSIAAHCREQANGIRCNSVHPGSIDTPMVHAALAASGVDLGGANDREGLRQQLGIGEPDDIASMVTFLASDEAKHINGAEMVVDNGDTVVYR